MVQWNSRGCCEMEDAREEAMVILLCCNEAKDILYIENAIISLKPNVQKETVWDQDECKIKTPFIIKTDSGPGHLCSNEEYVTKCKKLIDKGMYNLPSIPNGIKNNQQMDEGFFRAQACNWCCRLKITLSWLNVWSNWTWTLCTCCSKLFRRVRITYYLILWNILGLYSKAFPELWQ